MSQEADVVTPGFSISNLLGLEKINMTKGEIGDKKIVLEKSDEMLHSGKQTLINLTIYFKHQLVNKIS